MKDQELQSLSPQELNRQSTLEAREIAAGKGQLFESVEAMLEHIESKIGEQ